MSKFTDYINSLEGQENIDPVEVASTLLGFHNEEIGTRDAKIEELTSGIAEKDTMLSERESEITKWKAKNFDLAMQLPGAPDPVREENDQDNGAITIDDLFKKGK